MATRSAKKSTILMVIVMVAIFLRFLSIYMGSREKEEAEVKRREAERALRLRESDATVPPERPAGAP